MASAAILLLTSARAADAGVVKRLSVQGAKIYDDNGKEFVAHGMNWGKHSDQQLYNATDMAEMKRLMPWVNQIRVVFKWRTGKPSLKYDAYDGSAAGAARGYLTAEILAYLDAIVSAAAAARVWVVLTMTNNGAVSHLTNPHWNASGGCTPFVSDPAWRAEHQAMVRSLIRRYSQTDYIGWVEPWSEAKMSNCNATAKVEWMNELVAAVHAEAPEMPVAVAEHYNMCVGPPHWVKLASDKVKVIYPVNYWMPAHGMGSAGTHGYMTNSRCMDVWGFDQRKCFQPECASKKAAHRVGPHSYRRLMEAPLAFRAAHAVPLWADQWGAEVGSVGMDEWVRDVGALLHEYGWHSSWWTYKGASRMTCVGPRDLDCRAYAALNSSASGFAAPYRHGSECQRDYAAYVVNARVVGALNRVFQNVTGAPTAAPTRAPTAVPTTAATGMPTGAPTAVPSNATSGVGVGAAAAAAAATATAAAAAAAALPATPSPAPSPVQCTKEVRCLLQRLQCDGDGDGDGDGDAASGGCDWPGMLSTLYGLDAITSTSTSTDEGAAAAGGSDSDGGVFGRLRDPLFLRGVGAGLLLMLALGAACWCARRRRRRLRMTKKGSFRFEDEDEGGWREHGRPVDPQLAFVGGADAARSSDLDHIELQAEFERKQSRFQNVNPLAANR